MPEDCPEPTDYEINQLDSIVMAQIGAHASFIRDLSLKLKDKAHAYHIHRLCAGIQLLVNESRGDTTPEAKALISNWFKPVVERGS